MEHNLICKPSSFFYQNQDENETQTATAAISKGAAARRSAAARRERLNAGMKGRFKSSPNLNEVQAALTPRDDVSDDSTPVRHLPEAGDMTVVRAPVPRPESAHAHLLRARDSDEDEMTSSRFSQAQRSKANASLLMTQPPSVARVMPLRMSQPNINPTSSDVTSEQHDSSDEQIALDVDEVDDDDVIARPPREVTRSNAPSSLFGKSSRDVSTSQPISGSNAASVSNTAFLRKIYEANVGTPSPATMRTVSEINDVIKSQQAVKGPSPWHSRSTSGASSVSGNDATPAGSLSARELSTRGAEHASTPTMTSLGQIGRAHV